MRVYEFSKEYNISNKETLDILKGGQFAVSSHMKKLSDDQLAYLKKKLALTAKKTTPVAPQAATKSASKPFVKKDDTPEKVQTKFKTKPIEKESPAKAVIEQKFDHFVLEPMQLGDLAQALEVPVSELIIMLLKEGVVCNKNQILAKEVVGKIAQFYGKEVFEPKEEEVSIIGTPHKTHERAPIVVVIGHIDHGKTTLLDYIRKTRVAEREKGGITQHIAAYEAATKHGNVVFLDTPGHEAFTKMRMRGVKVADIAVLIIAADDGVMPQTVEAIRHAKLLQVPIIVAINKIDKVDPSRIETIKGQLAQHDLLPEDWGGQIIVVPISAKIGTGVDQLLELIVLQAQMMELATDSNLSAMGFVLESRLEKGRGAVATIICQHGILRVGDYFVCGKTTGRVTTLVDSYGRRIQSIAPALPVLISGFDELAQVGDLFQVVSQAEYKKARSAKGKYRTPLARTIFNEDAIPLIVKADTHSSREALIDSINRLSAAQKEQNKNFYVIHAGIGDINESDITLASSTGAQIVGFHVKIDSNALSLAQHEKVKVTRFQIIYKLLEYLQEQQKAREVAQVILTKTGEAVVRKVFNIKGLGVVAGSYIKEGVFSRNGVAKVWRGNQLLAEGAIKSLQRDKRTVKEVHAGYECGFLVENFNDFEVDDRVECYIKKTIIPNK